MRVDHVLMESGRCCEALVAAGIPAESLDRGERGRPCPKCGGRDRFAPLPDVHHRGALHCRSCFSRSSSIRPGALVESIRWWFGCDFAQAVRWLDERFGDAPRVGDVNRPRLPPTAPTASLTAPRAAAPVIEPDTRERLMGELVAAQGRITSMIMAEAAESLGVEAWAIESYRAGWISRGDGDWLALPMVDSRERLCGVRIRRGDGRKMSLRGSKSGLFVPDVLDEMLADCGRVLVITEGPTSAAAVLSCGVPCVGLPSATSGHEMAIDLAMRRGCSMVIMAGDLGDAGRDASARVAQAAEARGVMCVVINPPAGVSDPREWLRVAEARVLFAAAVRRCAAVICSMGFEGVNR